MKIYLIYFLVIGMGLSSVIVLAQETKFISLDEFVDKVLDENNSIKISEEDFNIAKMQYQKASAIYQPTINVSYTGIITNNPLMSFGSKLNQENVGIEDFDPTVLNNPGSINNFTSRLEINQPIINLDGKYLKNAARSKMEALRQSTLRRKQFLILEARKVYMELQLTYRTLDVLQKALKASQAIKEVAKNKYTQGILQYTDVLEAELRELEIQHQIQIGKSEIGNKSDYISFLIDENENIVFQPIDSLRLNTMSDLQKNVITVNRSDIKAMAMSRDSRLAMLKAQQMNRYPRLNAFGSYEIHDDKFYQADHGGYLLGLQISWNVFDGNKRAASIEKSRNEYNRSLIEYDQYVAHSKLELDKANRMLVNADVKIQLGALAVKQSKESLRIRTDRFKEGLGKTSDLLQSEAKFAQKELEYFQAIFEFNYAQAYIQFLTIQ